MKNIIIIITALALLSSCSQGYKVTITNDLDIERREIVTIPLDSLGFRTDEKRKLFIEDAEGNKIPLQIDDNYPGGAVLIDVTLKPKESKTFVAHKASANSRDTLVVEDKTFARFVPERIDDYAWENDLVAFRTYGPEAQRLVDENQKGGTLSSGIDCWLKRVHYPIIDKWYAKYVAGGTYHKDDGEGYDPYHVGASRGCGGLGFLNGDSLFVSKNFASHNILVNGPLRTVFELRYLPWIANGVRVDERKVITIDRGQQFCKVEAYLKTDSAMDFTVGITLHDKKGVTKLDSAAGTFRYWETIDESELGTGVVIDPNNITTTKDFRTDKKDLSHIYITAKKDGERITYYPGFAWKKAGAITTVEAWDQHLAEFSKRLQSPVKVKIEK